MVQNIASIVQSPDWLAHRYDPGHDAVHFIKADRALRRKAPFLIDENLPSAADPIVLRRADVVGTRPSAPINFIFHSAYCCSTLLANAYDRPGISFSLKEPLLLNDLVGWRHRAGAPEKVGEVLNDALPLLSCPFVEGERCVIKPSNVINGLATAMIALQPKAGVLLIHAPLEAYLGSIASKGLWGRNWVRDLLLKLLTDELVDLGFTHQDYFLQTDLQVAAVGWLAQHALFGNIASRWPDRVRTIDSETLLAWPRDALASLDGLFGVDDSGQSREAVMTEVFSHHAKFGEAFDVQQRNADQREAANLHRDEIAKVVEWTLAIADSASISLTLPKPLLTTIV